MDSATKNLVVILSAVAVVAIILVAFVSANPTGPNPQQPGSGLETGQLAPDFTITDVNGTAWSLSGHRGQVVLLDFMGTNCESCMIEMGDGSMQAVFGAHASEGFTIISIDVGGELGTTDPAVAWRFVRGLNADGSRRWAPGEWPIALDRSGLATLYRVSPLPQKFLLDATGKIVWKHLGIVSGSDLEAQVLPLLG